MRSSVDNPERIYLEPHPGAEPEETGRLWCQDKIWEDAIEYVRADLVEKVK